MRVIVPDEGKRHPSANQPLSNIHLIDIVQQFLLDFIGSLTQSKGDDGDVSALTPLLFAPCPITARRGLFLLKGQDGTISVVGQAYRETQDTHTIL
jgi:hypothetical protein